MDSTHSRYHKKVGQRKGEEKGEETGSHWMYLDGDAVWYKPLEDELVNFTLSPACYCLEYIAMPELMKNQRSRMRKKSGTTNRRPL